MNTLYVFLLIPAITIVDRFEYYVNELIKSLRKVVTPYIISSI